MAEIFISYRRDDSAAESRAIWERLRAELGRERVFMDVAGIPLGDDFAETIDTQLDGCRLMLVVIGGRWATIQDKKGRPRLHAANDYVHYEVATALKAAAEKRMRVVPVLIDDAEMPQQDELPLALHALLRRQAHELDFKRHTEAALQTLVDLARAVVGQAPSRGPVPPQPPAQRPAAPEIVKPRPGWMSDHGKDQYGHWAEFTVKGVVQRLRWIEPGEFWMGSTEAERKRFGITAKDESPRHRVRLTQGYWLADTACTQALWQTVVGDNPSHFTGDLNLPVEQVSWDDVTQKFLPALSGALGAADLRLPTEAQWEYACRAGTETAYAFGDLITPDQVNYDGSVAPPGGKPGLNRKKTVPVKALPANAWGLYQMHGNVWEWCADGKRTYSASSIADPDGGQGPSVRALRGGSWHDDPGDARSACRIRWHRDYRYRSRGFRLSLRSSGPEAGGR
jgi:formylglycine-generating enzyme required for sulfatase activity